MIVYTHDISHGVMYHAIQKDGLFMVANLEITPSAIKQISKPRSTHSAKLYENARKAERMACEVERYWDCLPNDLKILLKDFAYRSADKPKISFWRIALALNLAFKLVLESETDAVFVWAAAKERLKNAVFDAVESENGQYIEDSREIVASLTYDTNAGTIIGQDDAREYFKKVSSTKAR